MEALFAPNNLLFDGSCRLPASDQIIYYLFADWRSAVQQDEPVRRRRDNSAAESFYIKLKESTNTSAETDAIEFTFHTYSPAKKDSSTRLNKIMKCFMRNNRKRLELHAVLGLECMHVKYSYIKTKCSKHVISTDVYEIISCIACAKNNNVKTFYEYVRRITGYSRNYITYFMRIANLCSVYPRLIYASVSSDDFHKYLPYIVKKIEDDKDFWSTAC